MKDLNRRLALKVIGLGVPALAILSLIGHKTAKTPTLLPVRRVEGNMILTPSIINREAQRMLIYHRTASIEITYRKPKAHLVAQYLRLS